MTPTRCMPAKMGLFLVPMVVGATTMLAAPAMAAPGQTGHHACHGRMMHGAAARIEVTGLGKAMTEPDQAMISLGVTTQGPTAAEALSQNSAQQTAVIEALQAAGIEDRDLQTSGLNLNPMRDYSKEGQPPEITGYQAQNMLTVRVRDLDSLGQTLDAIVNAGANEVNGITFAREAADEVQDEARRQAVANARHSAEVMAEAAGLSLGPVLAMRDSVSVSGPQPMDMRAMAARDAGGPVPVAGGELTMTALVEMEFALQGDAAMSECSDEGHGMGHRKGGNMERHGGDQMKDDMPNEQLQDAAPADADPDSTTADEPAMPEAPAQGETPSN